ncbi:hypothetical protein L6452_28746 [Arctium lappa]|uniref:Uncharacterized protein n=1 Tax=Arctium lappa TaxID=4217 RepID=A0ACB8ZYQ4_ARCLA|nr:hypothetical protein L6452_28746 [Arctium lappa]
MVSTLSSRLLLPLGLCFLVLFQGCFAQLERPPQQHKQSRLRGRSDCQFDRITAREPNRVLQSEAGVSEFWVSDDQNDELDCAGVEVARHTINTKGLSLPFYANAPELVYVVRGTYLPNYFLVHCGTAFPGCPETFESGKEEFFDKHQKVFRYKEGDILALPAGAVHWTYNDGDTPIVLIVLRDTSNVANQLDRNFKKFFLAGNPQSQEGGYGGQRPDEGWGKQKLQEQESSNIFNGFDNQILQEVFNVEFNIVNQLKGQNDKRGFIVRADNLDVMTPEKQEYQPGNGIAQTICSTQLRANIADPAHADVYNPRGGRISSLNSHKLPILNWLQLSAEKGLLYKNAVLAPHYNWNSHSIIYVTSGNSRMQIVRNDGTAVFDGVVQEGQLIVVPQDFAVVKKAGEQGCEWVAFKTNDNAKTAQLAGRFSFLRALPEEVVANSYQISREQAKELKYNRQEGVILSPTSTSTREKKGINALLNGFQCTSSKLMNTIPCGLGTVGLLGVATKHTRCCNEAKDRRAPSESNSLEGRLTQLHDEEGLGTVGLLGVATKHTRCCNEAKDRRAPSESNSLEGRLTQLHDEEGLGRREKC